MKLKLHHVNFCSTNVAAMDAFYKDVLDMKTEPGLNDNRVLSGGYAGKVSFVTDGTTQCDRTVRLRSCGGLEVPMHWERSIAPYGI